MRYCKNQYKFFLNPLDPNTTNIAKDIFTIPTEDKKLKKYTKANTWLRKSVDIAKTSWNFEKTK